MQITVRFFATIRDRAGAGSVQVEVADRATVADLLKKLIETYPAIEPSIPTALIAVNQEYSLPGEEIHAGDEVALFPPVSGGSGAAEYPEYFAVTPDRLDFDSILATITRPETGAVCVFSGAVRGKTTTSEAMRATNHLEYEAYVPMAEKTLKQVADEIRHKYPKVQGIAIVQRIGTLQVGETTIFVACAAGHRDDGCFEGARYGIDRVKEIVPVWKKEVGTDAEYWVEGGYLPTPRSANVEAPQSTSGNGQAQNSDEFVIGCHQCGNTYSLDALPVTCSCGGSLDVISAPGFDPGKIDTSQSSMWRYRHFLLPKLIAPVTLGEGWTPLVQADMFGRAIHLKLENLNPTGAFKDRCASTLISLMVAGKISAVHDDSSGNAGAALAAYAARASIHAKLFIPENASPVKLGQIRLYGAQLEAVSGPRNAARLAAIEAASEYSLYISHIDHPFSVFAYKSIAYELWEQLDRRAPDAFVLPLGHGSQLLGIAMGFQNLLQAGKIEQMPHLFGIQSRACAPLWHAFHGTTAPDSEEKSLAEGIKIAKPVRGAQVLDAIRGSGGDILAVEEADIIEGVREFARRGLAIEPTSAVVWAGLAEITKRMPQNATIVASITGSGLKYPDLELLIHQSAAPVSLNGIHS